MNLTYYNQEIEQLLSDILDTNCFLEQDLNPLVDLISATIYCYDQKISKSKLKIIVRYLIEQKYQKHYVYHPESKYNQVKLVGKDDSFDDISDSDLIEQLNVDDNISDQIQLKLSEDLINRSNDYPYPQYLENQYQKKAKHIEYIKSIPQYEQKSDLWLRQRSQCLTATAIAEVLDESPYKFPIHILLDKCGRGEEFQDNIFVHHGKKYEEIGNMYYCYRNNIKMGEYGLIQHDKYPFIGASPDGICEKDTLHDQKLSKLVGRLLEIKFPYSRRINVKGNLDGDICPHYYYVQCQTQLFVTNMDECDFLQCKVYEYKSWEDYLEDSQEEFPGLSKETNLEKGCLIQLLPRKVLGEDETASLLKAKYLYPPKLHMIPEEIKEWVADEVLKFSTSDLSKDYVFDRVIYWRLTQVSCELIKFDTEWFLSKIPLLKQFWDYVLFYREHPKELEELFQYAEEIGKNKSADIFLKVNQDYLTAHPESKYQPLYQEETAWRIEYNRLEENKQKSREYWAIKNGSKNNY